MVLNSTQEEPCRQVGFQNKIHKESEIKVQSYVKLKYISTEKRQKQSKATKCNK